jgi:hypothetical protein
MPVIAHPTEGAADVIIVGAGHNGLPTNRGGFTT